MMLQGTDRCSWIFCFFPSFCFWIVYHVLSLGHCIVVEADCTTVLIYSFCIKK